MEGEEEYVFGKVPWLPEEKAAVQRLLETKIGIDKASLRPGPANKTIVYCAAGTMIEEVNNIFGADGWSSQVTNMTQDFLEEDDGKFSCACSAVVKIVLKNGTHHEDLGYGYARRQPSIQKAIETAKKIAVSDGLKRALRQFGHALGNCLAMKSHQEYLLQAEKQKAYDRPPTTSAMRTTAASRPTSIQPTILPTPAPSNTTATSTTTPVFVPSTAMSVNTTSATAGAKPRFPVPNFRDFQARKQQLLQQQQKQQDTGEVKHEYFPEEEYAQDAPYDTFIAPANNLASNANNPAPSIDDEQFEFEDESNLSQPHPDGVPLNEEEILQQEPEPEEYVPTPGQNFAQGFKRKAVSQPTTGSSRPEVPQRAWSQPNKSQKTFYGSSPNMNANNL